MSDFNQLPPEYRARLRGRRLMLLAASAAIAAAVLIGGTIGVALHVLAERESELLALRQQQGRLASLRQEKRALQSDLRLLSSLQSGTPVTAVVKALEAAAKPAGVHLESWSLVRAGIRTTADQEARPPSHYAPVRTGEDFPAQWESLVRLAVEGHVRDHAALSMFVKHLYRQPDVENVRIQQASEGERGVEFLLVMVVATTWDAA